MVWLKPFVAVVCASSWWLGSGLRCYEGTFDCFPEECPHPDTADQLGIDACTFEVDNSTGMFSWTCDRTFDVCKATDCVQGFEKGKVVECAEDEAFCYDHFRLPQNSRYGKSAVWGFQEVHIRGCAKTCTNVSQSKATGIGVLCCQNDLCNPAPKTVTFMLSFTILITLFLYA